VNIH